MIKINSDIYSWARSLLTNSATLVLGLITGVILARTLGPEGRGELAAILIWPNLLAPIGLLGLNEAVIYSLGKDREQYNKLLANSMLLVFCLSLVMIGVGFLFLPLFIEEGRSHYIPLVHLYIIFFIPVYFLSVTLMSFEQAKCEFKRYNFFQILQAVSYFLSLVVLWIIGAVSIESALWASVFAVAITALTLFLLVLKDLQIMPSLKGVMYLLKRGISFNMATTIALISSQMDKLFVIKFMDSTSIGYYFVAYTFATAGLNALSHATHTIMFPKIAVEKDHLKRKLYFYKGVKLSVLVFMVVAGVFAFSASWLLPLLFGISYMAASTLAVALIIASLPFFIRQVMVRSLRGFGVSRYSTESELISLAIFLTVVIPFFEVFSLLGIAYSLLVSNSISLAYLFWRVNVFFSEDFSKGGLNR